MYQLFTIVSGAASIVAFGIGLYQLRKISPHRHSGKFFGGAFLLLVVALWVWQSGPVPAPKSDTQQQPQPGNAQTPPNGTSHQGERTVDDTNKITGMPLPSTSVRAERIKIETPSPRVASGKSSTFTTDSYRLIADTVRKSGNVASVLVTVEGLEATTVRFTANEWYLIDENGERWDQEGQDTAEISGYRMAGNGVDLVPGRAIKSRFTFRAKGANTGAEFNLHASEGLPKQGRQIILESLQLR